MPYRDTNSPNWYISYTNSSGKRVRESSGTTDRKEAAALEAKRKFEAHQEKRWGEKPEHSYEQLMLAYMKDTPDKISHERDITSARALSAHFSGTIVERWQPEDIAAYKAKRRATITARGTRVSDATIGKELMLITAAIKHVNLEYDWGLPNVIRGRIPLPKAGRVRWLRPEEAEALKAAAHTRKRSAHLIDFIELGLSTGMRRDEMLQLEWSRVDFGQRLIYLDPDDQKGKVSSAIPLNATALRVLRERLDFHRRHAPKATYVFIDRFGARIASIKTAFYAAAEQAGLPDISPHTLRHTFAAWLVQAGVPLRTVCELCRHKDIRTTMRYAHLAPENGRAAIELLDAISQKSVRPDVKRA